MSFLSVGDLSQSIQLRRDTARVNSDILRLTNELSSGLKSDLGAATKGDFGPLAAIERDLAMLNAREDTAKEAELVGNVANDILGRISEDATQSSANLLLASTFVQPIYVDNAAADARQRFEDAVASLNTQVAGRSIFAGQAYDSPALQPAETILADLFAAVSAETTVEDAFTAIDAWFAPGGAFETGAYLGTAEPATPVRLGDGDVAQPTLRAIDPVLVEPLKAMASAALLDVGLFAGQSEIRAEMATSSGERLLSSVDATNAARASIGEAQQAVERGKTRIGGERAALELARNSIIAIDPYEAATQLQEAQTQLQTLYVITGRISNLSLANFLR